MLRTNSSLLLKLSIPIVLLALGIFYFFINPSSFAFAPKCPFHSLTGLHCPGCGSQRALHEILHGNLWTGLQHNFLILLAILVIGYKLYISYLHQNTTKRSKNLLEHNAAPWIIFTLILAFWILRNLPLDMFQILAP